jgi:hypothetical protein
LNSEIKLYTGKHINTWMCVVRAVQHAIAEGHGPTLPFWDLFYNRLNRIMRRDKCLETELTTDQLCDAVHCRNRQLRAALES